MLHLRSTHGKRKHSACCWYSQRCYTSGPHTGRENTQLVAGIAQLVAGIASVATPPIHTQEEKTLSLFAGIASVVTPPVHTGRENTQLVAGIASVVTPPVHTGRENTQLVAGITNVVTPPVHTGRENTQLVLWACCLGPRWRQGKKGGRVVYKVSLKRRDRCDGNKCRSNCNAIF